MKDICQIIFDQIKSLVPLMVTCSVALAAQGNAELVIKPPVSVEKTIQSIKAEVVLSGGLSQLRLKDSFGALELSNHLSQGVTSAKKFGTLLVTFRGHDFCLLDLAVLVKTSPGLQSCLWQQSGVSRYAVKNEIVAIELTGGDLLMKFFELTDGSMKSKNLSFSLTEVLAARASLLVPVGPPAENAALIPELKKIKEVKAQRVPVKLDVSDEYDKETKTLTIQLLKSFPGKKQATPQIAFSTKLTAVYEKKTAGPWLAVRLRNKIELYNLSTLLTAYRLDKVASFHVPTFTPKQNDFLVSAKILAFRDSTELKAFEIGAKDAAGTPLPPRLFLRDAGLRYEVVQPPKKKDEPEPPQNDFYLSDTLVAVRTGNRLETTSYHRGNKSEHPLTTRTLQILRNVADVYLGNSFVVTVSDDLKPHQFYKLPEEIGERDEVISLRRYDSFEASSNLTAFRQVGFTEVFNSRFTRLGLYSGSNEVKVQSSQYEVVDRLRHRKYTYDIEGKLLKASDYYEQYKAPEPVAPEAEKPADEKPKGKGGGKKPKGPKAN